VADLAPASIVAPAVRLQNRFEGQLDRVPQVLQQKLAGVTSGHRGNVACCGGEAESVVEEMAAWQVIGHHAASR
jgi:hypothetical protein